MARAAKNPKAYAAEKKRSMTARATGVLGNEVRRAAPIVWPGVPWQAFIGFTALSNVDSGTENTSDPPASNSFHEMGWFQTEGGPRGGPAPNPNPDIAHNNWGKSANDPKVIALLGRPASVAHNAWKTLPADQVAVGLVSIRKHGDGTNRQLVPALRVRDWSSQWAVMVAFTGFSTGDGGAARTLNRWQAQVAGIPEAQRWGAILIACNAELRAGTLRPGPPRHGNPAYDLLRSTQKLFCGLEAAKATNGDVSWFALGIADENRVLDGVTAGSNDETPSHVVEGVSGTQEAGGALGTVALVGGLGTAWWKRAAILDAIRRAFGMRG